MNQDTVRGMDPLPRGGPTTWIGLMLMLTLAALSGCASSSALRRSERPGVASTHKVAPNRASAITTRGLAMRAPFVSFNIPNLHYVEDDWRFTSMQRYRLPNEFEIHDALQTVCLLGASVLRMYTFSVRKATDSPETVRHVLGPGQFNEEAFVTLDRVLASAAELGIRVIIPFVDNWAHWGGVAEYAAFRGKPRAAFFTDEQLIADFERTLDKVLTRTNSINGRAYRDDPAIYAWETGNELGSPDAWVARIAKSIKQRDSNHAVIDGTYGPLIREKSLKDPNIDIVSSHHYGSVARSLHMIDANLRMIHGQKRYLIGEFGLLTARDTERLLQYAFSQPIEGILIWSLRYHNRDGGFYHHMEKPPFQAYHFPGSLLGHDYEEQPIMNLMRRYAYAVRREEVPVLPVPAAPSMLPVSRLGEVPWRGSMGARYYVVERQVSAVGRWEIVSDRIDESRVPYRPAFVDTTAPIGEKVRYRVVAANETGLSVPSLPSEEVLIEGRLFVDEMAKPQFIERLEGSTEFTTAHAELCKMDPQRLRGKAGARVVYRPKGHTKALRVYSFAQDAGKVFDLSWSSNDRDFAKLASSDQAFAGAVDQPVAFRPVLVSAAAIPPAARELAITWLMPAEIGRVEIQVGP
jgi:mannan endo-1,4-beta-mannosidase